MLSQNNPLLSRRGPFIEGRGELDIRSSDTPLTVGRDGNSHGATPCVEGEIGMMILRGDRVDQMLQKGGDILEVGQHEMASDDDTFAGPALKRRQFNINLLCGENCLVFHSHSFVSVTGQLGFRRPGYLSTWAPAMGCDEAA